MPKSEPKPRRQTQQVKDQNPPPPGYPTTEPEDNPTPKKCCHRTTKKGDRGFIEGCIFALCCCWICEECF